MSAITRQPRLERPARSGFTRKHVLALAVAAAVALPAIPAAAVGRLANVEIVTRADQRVQPAYPRNGEFWVVGAPGEEYAVRVCNSTGGRVLAVTSVDGVNVVTGETAGPSQSGYVLDPWSCLDIAGWRKSLANTAAFYFTELPDSYAARTGRPANVGVIGVAVFRERPQPIAYREPAAKLAAEARRDAPSSNAQADAASGAAEAPAAPTESKAMAADAMRERQESARGGISPTPAPAPQLGTGHGRSETSYAQTVRFERESSVPAETIAIRYDRRDNLVAMGILPPPRIARSPAPNPFPVWPRFAPDPPNR
jgi:hypothetical protein